MGGEGAPTAKEGAGQSSKGPSEALDLIDKIISQREKTIEALKKRGYTDELSWKRQSLDKWKKIRDDLRRAADRPLPKK